MDSLLPTCAHKFGATLALDQCFRLLADLFALEAQMNGTLERCPELGPAIVHNRQHFLGPCTALELFCLRFLFPLLQLLSLAGNVFNLLVYRLPYFSGSSAVHFLRAKALANLLFVQSRLFESLHAWLPLNPHLETLYWHSRPWLITLGNLNGTLATWMTLLICVETVVCVLWPFSLRRFFFSSRCTFFCLATCTSLAAAIHSLFLITHEVVPDPSLLLMQETVEAPGSEVDGLTSSSRNNSNCFRIAISFRMRSTDWAPLLERPYYWLQMTLTIVLPTLAMLLCSALIVSRFTLKPQLGQAFSQRRKCVTRLTVATATSHLLLEGPGTLCYLVFAIRGADVQGQADWMCALSAANNVLSALNASIPFFLFLLCSSQFRQMSLVCIGTQWWGGCGPQAKLSGELISQGGPSLLRAPTPAGENGSGVGEQLNSTAASAEKRGSLLEMVEERRRLLTASSWNGSSGGGSGQRGVVATSRQQQSQF